MRFLKISSVVALCVLLAGCMPFAADLQPAGESFEMPEVEFESVEPAIGDEVEARLCNATLYYPSATQQGLVPVSETVSVPAGETLEEVLVRTLLEGTVPQDVRRPAPEGTKLLSVYRSGAAAVVDLSVDARGIQSEQEMLLLHLALTETLCVSGGLSAVNVLIAGRSECPGGMPLGALSHGEASFASRWGEIIADTELTDAAQTIERSVVLYGLSRDGRFLIPHAETVFYENGDEIGALIRALARSADDGSPIGAPLPEQEEELLESASIVDLEDGRRVARLVFNGTLTSVLERGSFESWPMYAALTCTLTGFLPELDGVQICIGDGQLVRAESPSGEVLFDGGVMTRAHFENMIGRIETVYMTAEDGSLRALPRAMNVRDALSPRMLLAELFSSPRDWERGVSRVMPEELSSDDILGIRIGQGEAVVNLSAGFYAACQRLSAQQERNLVYAMVNTLTDRPDVRAVRFQIEGEPIDTLVSTISLAGPLLRNPGLIS